MAETGQPYGRTQYSEYPEQLYEKHRADRQELSASEYAVVIQGFMREYVCMGQCNIYHIAAKDPELKEAIETYLGDVCDPNIGELQQILEGSGYELPASLENVASLNELEDIDTKAIDDQMIMVAQWFATRPSWSYGTPARS